MLSLDISPSSFTSTSLNGVNFATYAPPVILKVLLTIFVVFFDRMPRWWPLFVGSPAKNPSVRMHRAWIVAKKKIPAEDCFEDTNERRTVTNNSLIHCLYVFIFEVKQFNMKIPFLLMNSCYLFPYHWQGSRDIKISQYAHCLVVDTSREQITFSSNDFN